MDEHRRSHAITVTIGIILLFIVLHLFGGFLFDNDWSFVQWRYMPIWYVVFWFILLAVVLLVLLPARQLLGRAYRSPVAVLLTLIVFAALFWQFRFDSFLFGGGNNRVAQIAQREAFEGGVIVYRWFELGLVYISYYLYRVLHSLGLGVNEAGANAFRILTYAAMILSMIASIALARSLTTDSYRRVLTFLLIFFGSQTLLYFGYVGHGPIVVAATLWFSVFVVRILHENSNRHIINMWGMVAIGLLFHAVTVYLVPVALFVNVTAISRNRRGIITGLLISLAAYAGLLIITYSMATDWLGLKEQLMYPGGRQPFLDYGMFSWRRIGDLVQLLFLAAPLLILIKYIGWREKRRLLDEPLIMAFWLLTFGGILTIFIINPIHSIVLDMPRYLAFLAPVGLLAAVVLNRSVDIEETTLPKTSVMAVAAAIAIVVPLSYAPVYLSLYRADDYVESYLDKHDIYYRTAVYTFRDAYFYIDDLDMANWWERQATVKSPELINLTGSQFLISGNDASEGLRTLQLMTIRNPFWPPPRALLARTQIKLNRYSLAQPQVDTLLMLDPYRREFLVMNYEIYRGQSQWAAALRAASHALSYFPRDTFILTDYMIINFRAGNFQAADSLADVLLARDSSFAYPYWVKGALSDRGGQARTAVTYYQKFLDNNPDTLDIPSVQRRMDLLDSLLTGEQ